MTSNNNNNNRLFGVISAPSIRNLLPRSVVRSTNIGKENTSPLDPNLLIGNPSPKNKHATATTTTAAAAAADPSSVKVLVRIRPPSWRERGDRIVQKLSPTSLSVGGRCFAFDSVVDSTCTQEDVFQLAGVPLVNNSLAGYNTSILSCGQTGAGKTYTMWGPPSAMVEGHSVTSNQGIVPRIFQMLFSEIHEQQTSSQINYQCRCSFLQIYNDQIGDLLDPTQRNLQIRDHDDSKTGFYVENLTEEYITTYDDVTQILIKGLSNRKVGATSINSKSSPSHIVFTCVVESWCKGTSSKCFRSSKTSRISLVDVAGPEQSKLDDVGRQCIKERRNVKKSLSKLGHVVHILAEGAQSEKSNIVPYRSSCLTHLLKESLGGNTKLTVICAISPDEKCRSETLSTLRFGNKVKSIQNEPVENEITEDDVNDLSDRIRQLKEELIKQKTNGYNTVSCSSSYYKGPNARQSLNQLRVSLNRSMILPRMDNDCVEVVNVDEKDVEELCVQLDNLRSSGEENFQDACEETDCFHDYSEELSESNVPNMNSCSDDEHDDANLLSTKSEKELQCSDVCSDNAVVTMSTNSNSSSKSSLSVMPGLPSFLTEPMLSESPKFENIQKRSIPTSCNQSASQITGSGISNGNPEVHMLTIKRSDHIRASLRSSKMFSNPTESLAASLHRGLQIIDYHQRVSSKSSLALSFEHLAVKQCQVTEGRTHFDEQAMPFICITCKQAFNESGKVQDSLNMCVVPFDRQGSAEGLKEESQKNGDTVLNESHKREELERVCAEQAARIEKLTLLVEQYKHEKGHNFVINHTQENITTLHTEGFTDSAGLMQDLEKEKHVLLEEEFKILGYGSDIGTEVPNIKRELRDLHIEKEALLKEIEILRNKLQSYVDVSWIESQSGQLSYNIESHSSDKPEKEFEVERQKWVEKESDWICLTDELRIDLNSSRRHAENVEMELKLEKKVTEELDDALNRSVLGHARIVEHYADLQDKYNELMERYRKIMEGIAEVKRAAAKAGAKGKGSRFAKSLAAELSALRVEREREREHLKKENKSLRVQLRDTAEAVHAAGELLVRLREAEEAVSVAEENYVRAQKETEKVKKQMEKQKRKHAMEMVTMKQYLAESRLPESALRPVCWQEEDKTGNIFNNDDQAWRAEFGTVYQEHY